MYDKPMTNYFFAKQNATPIRNYDLYTQKYKSNKQVLHFTLKLR